MKIEDVLRRNERKLMAIPGVVGVGIGESKGSPLIIVMVKELTAKLEDRIPRQLNGYAVKVEEVGEIKAL